MKKGSRFTNPMFSCSCKDSSGGVYGRKFGDQLRVQVRRLTLDDAQQLAAKVQFLYRVQVRRLAFDDAQQLHI